MNLFLPSLSFTNYPAHRVGRGLVRWVDLGTKAAAVADPDCPGRERYELRPCLKVVVYSLDAVDFEVKKCIAEAAVRSVEDRHGPGKRFSSEDCDSWLNFIASDVSQAELL